MMGLALYGCEGFAREVLPIARQYEQVPGGASLEPDIVFVEDDENKIGRSLEGVAVISFDDLRMPQHAGRRISICIASPEIRERLAAKCAGAGLGFFELADRLHVRFDNCEIGDGGVFCAYTMLTGHSRIGRHFHCNIYSYVAHDCEIGDFVTFAPRVSCNGRVKIGDRAYIGTGAVLKQGAHGRPLAIGKDAVVGMGSVVLRDVPDGGVVVGNPAKLIKVYGESLV